MKSSMKLFNVVNKAVPVVLFSAWAVAATAGQACHDGKGIFTHDFRAKLCDYAGLTVDIK